MSAIACGDWFARNGQDRPHLRANRASDEPGVRTLERNQSFAKTIYRRILRLQTSGLSAPRRRDSRGVSSDHLRPHRRTLGTTLSATSVTELPPKTLAAQTLPSRREIHRVGNRAVARPAASAPADSRPTSATHPGKLHRAAAQRASQPAASSGRSAALSGQRPAPLAPSGCARSRAVPRSP